MKSRLFSLTLHMCAFSSSAFCEGVPDSVKKSDASCNTALLMGQIQSHRDHWRLWPCVKQHLHPTIAWSRVARTSGLAGDTHRYRRLRPGALQIPTVQHRLQFPHNLPLHHGRSETSLSLVTASGNLEASNVIALCRAGSVSIAFHHQPAARREFVPNARQNYPWYCLGLAGLFRIASPETPMIERFDQSPVASLVVSASGPWKPCSRS